MKLQRRTVQRLVGALLVAMPAASAAWLVTVGAERDAPRELSRAALAAAPPAGSGPVRAESGHPARSLSVALPEAETAHDARVRPLVPRPGPLVVDEPPTSLSIRGDRTEPGPRSAPPPGAKTPRPRTLEERAASRRKAGEARTLHATRDPSLT